MRCEASAGAGANESSKFGDENRGLASPKRESAEASSLTTEYPANGSSFQNTHTQCERRGELTKVQSKKCKLQSLNSGEFTHLWSSY